MIPPQPRSTLFPYTTLFRSKVHETPVQAYIARMLAYRIELLQRMPIFGAIREDALQFLLRSEEHTSELQSHSDLVCRLLLEKKNKEEYLSRLQQNIRLIGGA